MTPHNSESTAPAAPDRLLTVREIASWLNMAPKTVYEWAAAGRIPCLRLGGRLRFEASEISRWLGERRSSCPSR